MIASDRCDAFVDPSNDVGLFLIGDLGVEQVAAVDKQRLFANVSAGDLKQRANVSVTFGSTVDHESDVGSTVFVKLGDKQSDVILQRTLAGNAKYDQTLLVAGVRRRDYVSCVDVELKFLLDHLRNVHQLFLAGGAKHAHFNCHNNILLTGSSHRFLLL